MWPRGPFGGYARRGEVHRSRSVLVCRNEVCSVWRHVYRSTDELLGSGVLDTLHDEVILIKGARSFRFDVLTEHLALKVHETTLEVNLNAVVDNLNYYRSFTQAGDEDGMYGKGVGLRGRCCGDCQNPAGSSGGLSGRGRGRRRCGLAEKAGITANIMIMNPEMSSFPTLFEYDL